MGFEDLLLQSGDFHYKFSGKTAEQNKPASNHGDPDQRANVESRSMVEFRNRITIIICLKAYFRIFLLIVSHLIFFILKRTEGGAAVDFIITLFTKQNKT